MRSDVFIPDVVPDQQNAMFAEITVVGSLQLCNVTCQNQIYVLICHLKQVQF